MNASNGFINRTGALARLYKFVVLFIMMTRKKEIQ